MKPTLLFLSANMEFGWIVAVVGFSIVIGALTLLVLVFQQLPKILNVKLRKLIQKKRVDNKASKEISHDEFYIEGNVTAAIGLALHMYFNEMHDEESGVVTIKRVQKAYSPWSSKIYEVNQNWPSK